MGGLRRASRERWFRRLAYWPDVFGIGLALVYAWPSTAYRFGRDQALFYYIGREWLHGSVPYRDAFDLKPPGIYAVHALAIALLGPHEHSIRILDVLAVLATAVVASLAVQRVGPRVPGELGMAAILACGWYFTAFDYWHTAQAEVWQGLALLGCYALLIGYRAPLSLRCAVGAGVLLGISGLFKFTAAVPGLGLGLLLLVRVYSARESGRSAFFQGLKLLAGFVLGTLTPWALAAIYFALAGALPAVWDMLELVLRYSQAELFVDPLARIDAFWLRRSGLFVALFSSAWLIATLAALRAHDRSILFGALSAMLLGLLCCASVYVQGKFFLYHWGVVVGAVLVLPLYAARAISVLPSWQRLVPGVGITLGAFFTAPPWESNGAMDYRRFSTHVWRGETGSRTLARAFTGISNYNYAAQVAIADQIRARFKPGDLLHVRGFELAIYALTGLQTPARFVSEVLFDDLRWATHPEQWSLEQERRIWSTRPRFIVTFADRPHDLAKIASQGYAEISRAGLFVLFERLGG